MRTADPGETILGLCTGFDTGLEGTLQVTILDSLGDPVSGPSATIAEHPASSGVYFADLTAPSVEGDFVIQWDTGVESETTVATEDLIVEENSDPENLAHPGDDYQAIFETGITDLVGTVGFQILNSSGTVVRARSTSNIVESPADSGTYRLTFDAPTDYGNYAMIWDLGSIAEGQVAAEELVVEAIEPNDIDLTTLEAVRSFLQKPTSDTNQDAVIAALITRASRAILNFCEREFKPATSDATREFDYDDSGWLDLAPYDLRAVEEVLIDTDNSSSELSSTYYRLWPTPAKDGVYTHLRLNPAFATGNAGSYFAQRRLSIRGSWGFASVPEDVEHACLVTVATWLRKDVAAFSTVFRIDEGLLERPEALPSEAAQILWRYKRTGYA